MTGRIADVALYLGIVEGSAAGSRTLLTHEIFKLIPFYGRFISNSRLNYTIISNIYYINREIFTKKNRIDWYLILYLPCLLIYPVVPSKELLFFIPATLYIIFECEDLIGNKNHKKKLYKKSCLLFCKVYPFIFYGTN